MDQISPKERMERVLERKRVDRKPVICPGGMMNAAIVEVMEASGYMFPEVHHDAEQMSALAANVHELTGFENFGLPFCMTVEAEVMGSEIDFGNRSCEPKIAKESFPSVDRVVFKDIGGMLKDGRVGVLTQAAYRLKRKDPDVPVIGSLTGPVSTAGSIVDPMTFLKELRKNPAGAHRLLQYVTDFLKAYALQLLDNGADIITIADPTATGEILGPKMFGEYAVPYLNQVIDAVHASGHHAILHICGDLKRVIPKIPEFHADAISTDAMVNLRNLKGEYPQLLTMGNISTFLLELGEAERIAQTTENLIRSGIDILAPACGLSTTSPLKNLQAFTETVRESKGGPKNVQHRV